MRPIYRLWDQITHVVLGEDCRCENDAIQRYLSSVALILHRNPEWCQMINSDGSVISMTCKEQLVFTLNIKLACICVYILNF